MARLGRDVFVGGEFTRAGGHAAEAIARWTMPAAPVGPGKLSIALAAKPNPATDQVSFRFTLVRGGRVRISIHDLRGALVARPVDEELTAGPVE